MAYIRVSEKSSLQKSPREGMVPVAGPWTISGTAFLQSRFSSCHPTNLQCHEYWRKHGTKSNQWPGFIPSSSLTRPLREGALLSDASAMFWYIEIRLTTLTGTDSTSSH